MNFLKPDENLSAQIEEKQKMSISPEIKQPYEIDHSHIPVIKAHIPHKKLSLFQNKLDENEQKFNKTAAHFNFRTNMNNDDSSDYNISNKMAFSEVFETSINKEMIPSPESKKRPLDFSLKAINNSGKSPSTFKNPLNNQKFEAFTNTFKRKSAVILKQPSPQNKLIIETHDPLRISPTNGRKIGDLKIFHPGVIKKKDELNEKIQKKMGENFENNNFEKLLCKTENFEKNISETGEKISRNHAKIKLTEAFQKAEIYNDKVVRQLNFEKENQEEEKNFQELFEVLNNLN